MSGPAAMSTSTRQRFHRRQHTATSVDGDILQHLPIKVAMAHFRPGVNLSPRCGARHRADATAPHDAGGPDRFVLFDTSEFFMPSFGRIERWPDLSALVGAGLPYGGAKCRYFGPGRGGGPMAPLSPSYRGSPSAPPA
jgi:hypothetical protein